MITTIDSAMIMVETVAATSNSKIIRVSIDHRTIIIEITIALAAASAAASAAAQDAV